MCYKVNNGIQEYKPKLLCNNKPRKFDKVCTLTGYLYLSSIIRATIICQMCKETLYYSMTGSIAYPLLE